MKVETRYINSYVRLSTLTNTMKYNFPQVTLLITHYNRSASLERLLVSFRELGCSFGEMIVSDDCSDFSHLSMIQQYKNTFNFKLITSDVNRGLGNNINKGQDAVSSPLTLYIQEDFVPLPQFPEKLNDAINFMLDNKELDIVRFYAYDRYPYLRPYSKGFSEMYIYPFAPDYKKIYYYSDHPHLRRSTFFQKFGRYQEGIAGDRTEYRMCVSFIRNKGKGLFYNDFQNLLVQKNNSDEPSTMSRGNWKNSSNPIIKLPREIYRQLRYNIDLLMPIKKFKSN